jgi:hypothetical protein
MSWIDGRRRRRASAAAIEPSHADGDVDADVVDITAVESVDPPATPEVVPVAAMPSIDDQLRELDPKHALLARELFRQTQETDRRLAARLSLQMDALERMLRDALGNIRAAVAEEVAVSGPAAVEALTSLGERIPDGFERLLDLVPEEMAKVRSDHVAELQRLDESDRALVERLAEATAESLRRLEQTFEAEIEALRTANREEGKRLRAATGEELVRIRVANAGELESVRALPDRLAAMQEEIATVSGQVERALAELRGSGVRG